MNLTRSLLLLFLFHFLFIAIMFVLNNQSEMKCWESYSLSLYYTYWYVNSC